MTVQRGDLGRLALKLGDVATKLAADGDTAWTRTRDWQHGPAAAHTDPDTTSGARASRWELELDDHGNVIAVHPIPIDPTGETAVRQLPAPSRAHDRLRQLLDTIGPAVEELGDLLGAAAPTTGTRKPRKDTPAVSSTEVPAMSESGERWRPMSERPLVERLRLHDRPTMNEAADRIEALEGWKAEALVVLAEWERVWEAAGRPGELGWSKAAATHDRIRRWRRDLAKAERLNVERRDRNHRLKERLDTALAENSSLRRALRDVRSLAETSVTVADGSGDALAFAYSERLHEIRRVLDGEA